MKMLESSHQTDIHENMIIRPAEEDVSVSAPVRFGGKSASVVQQRAGRPAGLQGVFIFQAADDVFQPPCYQHLVSASSAASKL